MQTNRIDLIKIWKYCCTNNKYIKINNGNLPIIIIKEDHYLQIDLMNSSASKQNDLSKSEFDPILTFHCKYQEINQLISKQDAIILLDLLNENITDYAINFLAEEFKKI